MYTSGNPSLPHNVMGKTDFSNPRDIAKVVRFMWDQRSLKDELEARTARNIAFVDGRQLYEWNPTTRQMVLPQKVKKSADLLVFNVVKSLVQQKLAKLGRQDPVWTVASYTSDEWDQMVARFSNDLLGWYYKYGLRMGEKVDKLLRLMLCSPVCWLEPTWDPTKGDPVNVALDDFYRDSPQAPDNADQGTIDEYDRQSDDMRMEDLDSFRKLIGYKGDESPVTQYTGDIDVRVRSIFKVMWYPFFVEEWSDVRCYLVTDVMCPEEVAQRFDMTIDEVMKYRGGSDAQEHHEKILRGWTSPTIHMPTMGSEFDNGILVHQFYADKCIAPPNGASAVLLGRGDKTIRHGPLGNALKKLPLYPIVEHPSEAFAWGTCSVDDVISAQVEINNNKTDLARWRKKRITPKIIKDKTDGGTLAALEKPDAVYECRIDKRPQVLQLPMHGIEEEQSTAWDLRFMHDSMSVPDVSMGRTQETQAKSGKAVIALQEEANERHRTPGKALNSLMGQVGTHILAELQEKATAERITPIVGENNAIEFTAWSSALLRPTLYAEYPHLVANVNVDSFTNIPTTNAEMRQLVLALYELKILRPGEHDRILGQVFGMNDIRTVIDEGRSGRDKAEATIAQWRRGEHIPPPSRTDDHVEAAKIIGRFISSDEFISLARRDPSISEEIMFHLEAHEQGKYDAMAEEEMRKQYAHMRAAALFANRAGRDGLYGAQMMFLAQANGGMLPGGNAMKQPTDNEDRRGDQPGGQEQDRNGGDRRPVGRPTPGQQAARAVTAA